MAPLLKNWFVYLCTVKVLFPYPFEEYKNLVTISLACWFLLGWNQKMCPSSMKVLLTEWKSCWLGWSGSDIASINCHRFAWSVLSGSSSNAISHVKHNSIWFVNCYCSDCKLKALALTIILVSNFASCTRHSLILSVKTSDVKEKIVLNWWQDM